jgi:hypothetical protein
MGQKGLGISSSMVKTFEYVIGNKMHEYRLEDVGRCLVAMVRI